MVTRAARPIALLCVLGLACTSQEREHTWRHRLLELHEAQRRAHLAEDAAGLVALFADDFSELRDGVLTRPTRAESEARLRRYFDSVEFLAWDDLAPPELRLAADGSLATVAVQKLVRVRTTDADGQPLLERTLFAWLATCVREGERWRLASIASTRRRPGAETTLAAARHALGAEDRLARIAGVRARVRGSGPSGDYALALDLPRAGPWLFRWEFPGRPPSLCELDSWEGPSGGERGWSVEGETRTPLSAAEVAMVRGHAFPWLVLEPERFFRSLDLEGSHAQSGAGLLDRERLHLVDRLGEPGWIDFDLASDRLARLEVRDTSKDPPENVRIDFETWQTVEGVLLPARVVAHDARGAWTMELEQVELDFD